MKSKYPVVYFVFKRPAYTLQFLDIFKNANIKKIYIFADGPRDDREKIDTEKVKSIIHNFQLNNPEIEIICNYSQKNIGLKKNIINGLTKVFSIENAAIIIEDDCLPTLDFFKFVNEMLNRYENEPRIMSVNGTSPGGSFKYSYDFTKYSQCWGWATWARSWKLYDPELLQFNSNYWTALANQLKLSNLMRWYWYTMLVLVKDGWINTWDFQWSYAHFANQGLAIAPSVNLIKNIGFDSAATNTKTKTSAAAMSTQYMKFPLIHPIRISENLSVTKKIESSFYSNPVAILGLIRQYIYWIWSKYAHRY